MQTRFLIQGLCIVALVVSCKPRGGSRLAAGNAPTQGELKGYVDINALVAERFVYEESDSGSNNFQLKSYVDHSDIMANLVGYSAQSSEKPNYSPHPTAFVALDYMMSAFIDTILSHCLSQVKEASCTLNVAAHGPISRLALATAVDEGALRELWWLALGPFSTISGEEDQWLNYHKGLFASETDRKSFIKQTLLSLFLHPKFLLKE